VLNIYRILNDCRIILHSNSALIINPVFAAILFLPVPAPRRLCVHQRLFVC